ncbi:MAG: methyltransferase domain-containing protein [Candidatus Gastranaerophilales bacterium]|nr:methyltransferase domain-containing protein [Candidatus Gastranaerophilales bacterium]
MQLPQEIDDYIFNEMHAIYQPDPVRVMSNLTNSEKEHLNYLGTYFPRSFIEVQKAFRKIFNLDRLYRIFNRKDEIKIVDIGSGTGGALLGLLWEIYELYDDKVIKVLSIDGNEEALNYQANIISEFFPDIDIEFLHLEFTKREINTRLKRRILRREDNYDIILSSKCLCELYNSTANYGSYKEFFNLSESILSINGIVMLVDVTSKPDTSRLHIPQLINLEFKNYRNSGGQLKTIYPYSCYHWEDNKCKGIETEYCFMQNLANIEHSRCGSEISKYVYRIFGNEHFADKVMSNIEIKRQYKIAEYNTNRWPDKYCYSGEIRRK